MILIFYVYSNFKKLNGWIDLKLCFSKAQFCLIYQLNCDYLEILAIFNNISFIKM